MTNLKIVSLSCAAAILLVSFALFAAPVIDAHSDGATPAAVAASDSAPEPALESSALPVSQSECVASLDEQTPSQGESASTCPSGWAWTCCSCGGCGCRRPGLSVQNFCQCF